MNWIAFFAIVIVLFLLCGLVIPFGRVFTYTCKWNIWYKWINYINKNHPQDGQEEGKKQGPSHIHSYKQDKPQ